MEKIIFIIALMCLAVMAFGQYNDMIGESYQMQKWPGRVSVYAENGNYCFQYNVPDDFKYAVVTPQNKLLETFEFKSKGVQGVMYLKIQKADKSWTKGQEYPIVFRDNQFVVSEVPFDKLFGTGDEITVSFVWEFKQGHNLVDHSPFAVKEVEFQATLKRNGNVVPKGSPT